MINQKRGHLQIALRNKTTTSFVWNFWKTQFKEFSSNNWTLESDTNFNKLLSTYLASANPVSRKSRY